MKIFWYIILCLNLILIIICILALSNVIYIKGDAVFSLILSSFVSLLAIGNIVIEKRRS